MEKISYRPLPEKGSIRLLIVEPCIAPNQLVTCRLEHHNFEDPREYQALSYTWGDEKDVLPLLIDGTRCLAQRNLVEALTALHLADGAYIIWVDAICINQADILERNNQVSQMKAIYSRAKSVVVWLGAATAFSDLGLKMVQMISTKLFESRHDSMVKVGSTLEHGSAKGTMSIAEFQHYYKSVLSLFNSSENIQGLDEAVQLLSRRWWTRIWTLQESVLCQEVTVHCGKSAVPLYCFYDLAYFIFFSMSFGAWPGGPVDQHVAVREVWRIADLRDHITERGHIKWLLALDSSWNRDASDPKDKVIGLLGLIGSGTQIMPDYSSTTAKVYQQAFVAAATEEKSLSFLGFISEEYQLRDPRLPTWLPDLQLHSKPNSDYIASLSKAIFNRSVYNASLSSSWDSYAMSRNNDESVLVVSGVEVDTVATIASQAPGKILTDDPSVWVRAMEVVLQEWRSHMPKTTNYLDADEPSAQAFWRCVLVDLKQGSLHAKFDPGKPIRMDEGDYPSLSNLDSDESHHQLLSYWASFCRLGVQLRLIEQFNRRFFVSDKGYIGMGPPWLEQNDKICILLGGSVPYVLRRSLDNTWTYVGECYVHGIMDGEVIRQTQNGEYSYQEFRIK